MRYLGRSVYAAAIIIMVLAISAPAWAEEEQLPDKFMLRLGGYHVRNADTVMRLDHNGFPVGAYVDFNDTLGGENTTTVFRADGIYRFNEHHAVSFGWYEIKFTGSRVLTKDIQWGDQNFLLGTQVDSRLKYDIVTLNYRYSLYHNDKVELGALAGIFALKVSADINGTNIGQSAGQSVLAPLPVLGLFADYKFTPHFSLYYNYQVFTINYQNEFKGSMQDFLLGLEYRLFKNISLGAAYNRFNANVDLKKQDTTLIFDTGWNGLMLYGGLYF